MRASRRPTESRWPKLGSTIGFRPPSRSRGANGEHRRGSLSESTGISLNGRRRGRSGIRQKPSSHSCSSICNILNAGSSRSSTSSFGNSIQRQSDRLSASRVKTFRTGSRPRSSRIVAGLGDPRGRGQIPSRESRIRSKRRLRPQKSAIPSPTMYPVRKSILKPVSAVSRHSIGLCSRRKGPSTVFPSPARSVSFSDPATTRVHPTYSPVEYNRKSFEPLVKACVGCDIWIVPCDAEELNNEKLGTEPDPKTYYPDVCTRCIRQFDPVSKDVNRARRAIRKFHRETERNETKVSQPDGDASNCILQ